MYSREVWMEIHVLKAQGLSERAIARQLGIARNTVARYLQHPEPPRYAKREPRPTKLTPFESYIRQRIAEAAPDWICAPAMLRELRQRGYTGGLRQLQAFLQHCKPVPRPDPVVRFETAPGQQLQVDFVTFRRGRQPLYAFTGVMGYSRYRWLRFVPDERAETLVRCHELLFEHLGGVPREVLYDNPKTVVLRRDAFGEGEHRFNPLLIDTAKRYSFAIRLCRPYRARTKGKVERFHRYLRQNFYVPLASRLAAAGMKLDVETANAEVDVWLREVANARIHEAHDATPQAVFDGRERGILQQLPHHRQTSPADSPRPRVPLIEPLQHPLSVYQQWLTEAPL